MGCIGFCGRGVFCMFFVMGFDVFLFFFVVSSFLFGVFSFCR